MATEGKSHIERQETTDNLGGYDSIAVAPLTVIKHPSFGLWTNSECLHPLLYLTELARPAEQPHNSRIKRNATVIRVAFTFLPVFRPLFRPLPSNPGKLVEAALAGVAPSWLSCATRRKKFLGLRLR